MIWYVFFYFFIILSHYLTMLIKYEYFNLYIIWIIQFELQF